MANQHDIEQLLRRIPLATPADESNASDLIQMVTSLRNAAFEGVGYGEEGAGIEIPVVTTAFSIPALIRDMKEGNYADVAVTLISVVGDAGSTFSFLVTVASEMDVIISPAIASAQVVGTMVAEIAGPATLSAQVLLAIYRIPSTVDENNSKLYFLADASGILTSWIFNKPEINPHMRLMRQARTGGYRSTDISEQCRLAHDRVQQLWRSKYQGNAQARRQARQSSHDSWEQYWLDLGGALAQGLHPHPNGVGRLWVLGLINDAKVRIREAASARSMRRFEERQRRASGGSWVSTSAGQLFVPDR